MGQIERFKDLEVWDQARRSSNDIHQLSTDEAFSYDYPLQNQLRRAANSIALNIAEGFVRRNDAEFAQFLNDARGSNAEVEASLSLAHDRGCLPRANSMSSRRALPRSEEKSAA